MSRTPRTLRTSKTSVLKFIYLSYAFRQAFKSYGPFGDRFRSLGRLGLWGGYSFVHQIIFCGSLKKTLDPEVTFLSKKVVYPFSRPFCVRVPKNNAFFLLSLFFLVMFHIKMGEEQREIRGANADW